MPFDPDSGLVFNEVILKKPQKHRGGLMSCVGRPPDCRSSGDGSDSLSLVALRRLLSNLDMLDSVSLSTVPEALLNKIWKTILRSRLDSLHVWRIFAQSEIGGRHIIQDHSIRAQSIDLALEMVVYPDCAWVTNLDILTEQVSPAELVRISEFQSLRSIHIATSREHVKGESLNDRVLKTWAEHAREVGSFRRLQYMFLYFQEGITWLSLDRLSAFPALVEVCAYRCDIDWRRAKKSISGWRRDTQNGFAGFIKTRQVCDHLNYSRALKPMSWNSLVTDYLNTRTATSEDPFDHRPVLNVVVKRQGAGLRLVGQDEIICLQRSAGPELDATKKQQMTTLPTVTPTVTSTRPPMKKRKLIADSTALEDMM